MTYSLSPELVHITFDSARSAIDTISIFESKTQFDWEYDIRCSGEERWRVHAHQLGTLKRGFINLDAEFQHD